MWERIINTIDFVLIGIFVSVLANVQGTMFMKT